MLQRLRTVRGVRAGGQPAALTAVRAAREASAAGHASSLLLCACAKYPGAPASSALVTRSRGGPGPAASRARISEAGLLAGPVALRLTDLRAPAAGGLEWDLPPAINNVSALEMCGDALCLGSQSGQLAVSPEPAPELIPPP